MGDSSAEAAVVRPVPAAVAVRPRPLADPLMFKTRYGAACARLRAELGR